MHHNRLYENKLKGVGSLHCRYCGEEVPVDSKYCFKCGENLGDFKLITNENTLALQADEDKKKIPGLLKVSFGIAIASVFLFSIGIIPLTGIVINVCSLIYYDKKEHRGLWMPILGLIISAVFMLENVYENGHLDRFK